MDVGSDGALTDPSKLAQGSAAWLAWRGLGIGASDAPAVVEASPWTTRFQLWAQKSGLLEAPEPHIMSAVAMRRGTELEPVARALYIERTGIQIEPATMTHATHGFIRCSLDGWNAQTRHVVEIKCPGKADLLSARKGKIPTKYSWQLAHQCIVADPLTVDYVTFDGKQELIVIPFERDREKEEFLLKELLAFWDLVQTKQPPPISVKDLRETAKSLLKQMGKLAQTVKAVDLISSLMSDEDVIDL